MIEEATMILDRQTAFRLGKDLIELTNMKNPKVQRVRIIVDETGEISVEDAD